jgi:predicted nucleic acid-binding protein
VRRVVLDANSAIDWFIVTEEGEAYSRHLEPLIYAGDIRLVVPLHFDVEVSAYLVRKQRQNKRKFTESWLTTCLDVLDVLPIEITAIGVNFRLLGDLSKAFNLSVYDTPYLQLARNMELPLVTRDRGLISACKQWNVLRWMPD